MNAETILSLLVRARDETKGVLATVNRSIHDISNTAESAAKGGLSRLKTSFINIGDTIRSLIFNQFSLLLGGAGIGGLVTSALSAQDAFEKGLLKYKTLLGSEEEALTRINELKDFAAKTPFELEGIIRADTILQGFGIRTSELLTTIGDAAAISGSDMTDLSLVLGQLSQSKDLENIKQLVEKGVVSFNELKAAGISFASDGSVVNSVDETYGAVVSIMQKKFGGGMGALSNTLSGRVSTLKDNFKAALSQIAADTGMQDFAKNAISSIAVLVEEYTPKVVSAIITIKNAFVEIFTWMQENKDIVMAFLISIGIVVLFSVVPAFIAWAVATIVATAPLLALIVAIAAVVYAIMYLIENFDLIKAKTIEVFESIKSTIETNFLSIYGKFEELREKSKIFDLIANIILLPIKTTFETIKAQVELLILAFTTGFNLIKGIVTGDTDLIKSTLTNFGTKIVEIFRNLFSPFTDVGGSLASVFKDLLNGVIDKINGVLDFSIDVGIKTVNVDLPDIPRFAKGINRVPRDMFAMIHQGEAIVPAKYNPYNPNATAPINSMGNQTNDNKRVVNIEKVEINNNMDFEIFKNKINANLNI